MSWKVFDGMTWNGQPLLLKIEDMPDVMLPFCHKLSCGKGALPSVWYFLCQLHSISETVKPLFQSHLSEKIM